MLLQRHPIASLVWLWQWWQGTLGDAYLASLAVAIVLSVIVGIRAAVNMRHGRPAARQTEDVHWRMKSLYVNPQDPALFVPLRNGVGWTLNFGRPRAVMFLLLFVAFGICIPIILLRLLLGQ